MKMDFTWKDENVPQTKKLLPVITTISLVRTLFLEIINMKSHGNEAGIMVLGVRLRNGLIPVIPNHEPANGHVKTVMGNQEINV